eukprot:7325917-Prymnesium_polylepis.1
MHLPEHVSEVRVFRRGRPLFVRSSVMSLIVFVAQLVQPVAVRLLWLVLFERRQNLLVPLVQQQLDLLLVVFCLVKINALENAVVARHDDHVLTGPILASSAACARCT